MLMKEIQAEGKTPLASITKELLNLIKHGRLFVVPISENLAMHYKLGDGILPLPICAI